MSEMTFSFVDVIVVLIVAVSTVYALYRGFVSETLSIFSWAAAAFAALYFGPWVTPLLDGIIGPEWLSLVAAYGLVFVAVLIPLSFASHHFAKGVKESPIGALDRMLGGVFGIVRGLALIGILYLVYSVFVPIKEQPEWVTEAHTLPVIQGSSEVLLSLVPPEREDQLSLKSIASGQQPAAKSDSGTTSPSDDEETYGADERRALDRLIQSTDKGQGQP